MSKLGLNIGSKPLAKLIDAVAGAIGVWNEPNRIRRKAQAESDAEIIRVKGRIKQAQLLKRAAQRLAYQEIHRQENIEAVVDQAKQALPGVVSDLPVDPDWVSAFFTACQDVSNEQLRQLWGRLLAMEVGTPGRCSRSTLHVLQQMGADDARLFEAFGSFVWFDAKSETAFAAWLQAEPSGLLDKYGFAFGSVMHLDSLGLLHFTQDVVKKMVEGEIFRYCGQDLVLTKAPNKEPQARLVRQGINVIMLTTPGTELCQVIKPVPNESYFKDVVAELEWIYQLSLTRVVAPATDVQQQEG